MRACSWSVRGADGPFEGRRHAPAARSSRWVTYTTRGSNLPSRRSSDSTCEGTGGASVNTQTGGSRRLLRCTSTPFGSALGASAAIGHGARLADAARSTTVLRGWCPSTTDSRGTQQGENGGTLREEIVTADTTLTTRPAVSSAESRPRCILGAWPPWPPFEMFGILLILPGTA